MEKRKGLLRILQRSRAQNDDREMMCRRTENREAEKAERETEREESRGITVVTDEINGISR